MPVLAQEPVKIPVSSSVLSLAEIDALIKDTNYDKALSALAAYQRQNPENFDQAQIRVKKIFDARNKYTVKAEELIGVIQNDPGNDKRILDIISELRALERHPSDKQLAFIDNARVAAQFNYYRKQFIELQNRSESLVASGDYTGAVDAARSGFYMYQDDFFEQYTDPSVVNPVRSALASVDSGIDSFRTIQDRLTTAVDAFVTAVKSGDPAAAERTYSDVKSVFGDYARIRNTFYENGHQMQTVFNDIKTKNPDITDASFLPFVSRFILGRTSSPDSGIAGAVDGEWNVLVERMKNAVRDELQSKNSDFAKAASDGLAGLSPSDSAVLGMLRRFAVLGTDVNGLYSLLSSPEGVSASPRYPAYQTSLEYEAGLAQRTENAAGVAQEINQQKRQAEQYTVPENPAQTELKGGSGYITSILGIASSIEKTVTKNAGDYSEEPWAKAYNDLIRADADKSGAAATASETPQEPVRTTAGVQIDDQIIRWNELETAYDTGSKNITAYAQKSAEEIWKRTGDYYVQCGSSYVASCNDLYVQAQTLFNGRPIAPGSDIIGKYPQEALDAVQSLRKSTSDDRAVLVNARTVLDGSSYKQVTDDPRGKIASFISQLEAFDSKLANMAADAQQQIVLAQRSRNEADLRLSQAKAALASENFETARKRLQDARTKYNESLSYQESATLRASSDDELAKIGNEIARQENEVVVRDVRRLKTAAKNAYFTGDFEKAENLLNQARARWAVTNVDEDSEITNLTAMVSTALSMKTGRVIPPTAPLYPEMSQLLSIATTNFNDGQKLIRAGKRADGTAELQAALQKLQQVQVVYPLNQEASLLTLRIHQVLDPAGFTTMFANRVTSARASYRNAATQREAYTDLLDLYQINPSYPGLKQLIYDVEIDIGIRQKPIDHSAETRSKQLTAQAQSLVNSAGKNEAKLRQALARVDQAIELDPNNEAAMMLKDKIQVSVGGKAAVVLSSEDESKYQQAIQEMQKNNIITANTIVEQLLQKSGNKSSPKLLELQKKIKALL